jgi:hypothetical protein
MGSNTADTKHAHLSNELFREGNRLILFLEIDQQRQNRRDNSQGRTFLSPDENCGAILATDERIRAINAAMSGPK